MSAATFSLPRRECTTRTSREASTKLARHAWQADDPKDQSAAFGVAKANCERVVRAAFGDHAVVVRPTYIVGPGDTTDRFAYWPQRLARGGEVLAPGRRNDPVQFIDVRNLAEFMVLLLEDGKSGVYNVVGPQKTLTMPEFLEAARSVLPFRCQIHLD